MVEVICSALSAGAPAVLFRERDLESSERRRLGHRVAEVVRQAGAMLAVSADACLARELGAGVLHLPEGSPRPTGWHGRVGVSCHDVEQILRAGEAGFDYVTLSPVYPSISKVGHHPDEPLAGLRKLSRAGVGHPPVWALGGVSADRIPELIRAGATGVAVCGAVMSADDPAAATRELLRVMEGCT